MEIIVLDMRFPIGKSIDPKGISRIKENVFIVDPDDVDYFINTIRAEVINALSENAFNVPDGSVCKPLDNSGWYMVYRAYVDNWVCVEGYSVCGENW